MSFLPYSILSFFTLFRFTVPEKSERDRILSWRNGGRKEDLELPLFNLPEITTATDNFSVNNKLGQGGFGPVYKVSFSYASLRERWDNKD